MLYIYTDGSCKNNPGPGAFGVIIMNDTKSVIIHAYRKEEATTTNNREELKALLYALEYAVNNKNNFIIYTDSSYSEKIINEWISRWASNNWKNSKNETVENLDLIKSLYYYYNIEFPNFQVKKTRGHCGDVGNELADAIATGNVKKITKIFKENDLIYDELNEFDKF